MLPAIFIQVVSHIFINTSFKYHRVTCTQSCVIARVHDLLGQPSYILGAIKNLIHTVLLSTHTYVLDEK